MGGRLVITDFSVFSFVLMIGRISLLILRHTKSKTMAMEESYLSRVVMSAEIFQYEIFHTIVKFLKTFKACNLKYFKKSFNFVVKVVFYCFT
jgi:hypothetical protein